MIFPRSLIAVTVAILVASAGFAADPATGPAETEAPPILPQTFGGWQMQGTPQISVDPEAADPTNAAVLKEYGFSDAAISTYVRDDGRTLKIRAARFADASGAFGAYTFYLQPEMNKERDRK